jgi:hypothetical protein
MNNNKKLKIIIDCKKIKLRLLTKFFIYKNHSKDKIKFFI